MRAYFRMLLAAIIIGVDVLLLGIFLNMTGWLDAESATERANPTPWPTSAPLVIVQPTPTPRTSQTYVVRSGDVLAEIARRYGVSVEDIQRASGIADPNTIRAGQTITIPVGN